MRMIKQIIGYRGIYTHKYHMQPMAKHKGQHCCPEGRRMFLNIGIFKKNLKTALKSAFGLQVGRVGELLIVRSNSWYLEADIKEADKEFKGELIKIIGDFPADGQAWTYYEKESPQERLIDTVFRDIYHYDTRYVESGTYSLTDMTFGEMIVMQHAGDYKKCFLLERVIDMINPLLAHSTADLYGEWYKLVHSKDFFIADDTMAFITRNMAFEDNAAILNALDGINIKDCFPGELP